MDVSSHSDSELVRRCGRGDARAWREFAGRFTKPVYALCLRMLRNSAEAEDATQETFLRVHKYFGGLDPTRPVAPWVSSIAYRECLKRLHEVARAPSTVEDIEEPGRFGAGEGDALPTDVAEHGEEAGLLRTSLASLAAQDRAILHLHYWEGLSTSEVSQAVDMPVGTVKIRLFRARNRLRELLEPSFQEVW